MFDYVVDYDEVAPFAQVAVRFAYDNIVNGFVEADGWPLIINFPVPKDGTPARLPDPVPEAADDHRVRPGSATRLLLADDQART